MAGRVADLWRGPHTAHALRPLVVERSAQWQHGFLASRSSFSECRFRCSQRSAVAAEFAASLGLHDLYNVEGGHQAWAEAGYPMET